MKKLFLTWKLIVLFLHCNACIIKTQLTIVQHEDWNITRQLVESLQIQHWKIKQFIPQFVIQEGIVKKRTYYVMLVKYQ